ncbi:Yip1 family protein [Chromatiaceae bacterium AAb-1]|nr:Yip1 family protein [Chromatiaceae bacterium AAb-1]
MILNHLWGLYAHPKEEWHTIDKRHESFRYSLIHILIVALIPSICAYYSAVHLGWSIGAGEPIRLTSDSALMLSVCMYAALIIGVFALAWLAQWMANTFGASPSYTQALELAAYTSTPLFMVGFAGLYPELWFVVAVGLVGLAYSVYLLYVGVPILMHIPEERGFIYASSVVTCGLVLLVCILAATAILWSTGFGPAFTH